jgi:hypothetical protein
MTFDAVIRVVVRAQLVWAVAGLVAINEPALAFMTGNRWTFTASGSTGGIGHPVTLTWSIAPDGTPIPGQEPSNLIAHFDAAFNVTSPTGDLTERPWFTPIQQSFDRWGELSGITFVYSSQDNGSQLQTSPGALNVRGDVRLGGEPIDGTSGTVAYAWFPNQGDVIFDTSQGTNFFSKTNGEYHRLRNVLMHELGHALGLEHIVSSSDKFLMEPSLDLSFDGPQLDDIRAIQSLYGDVYEKSFGGQGNSVFSQATNLGSLASGGILSVGRDAAGDQSVGASQIDFVSIANQSDVDFFSFAVSVPSLLDVTLTPQGGSFMQRAEGQTDEMSITVDANSASNLALAVFAPNGTTLLGSADLTPAGGIESLVDLSLSEPGQYYVRVNGSTSVVQLYQLDLSATSMAFFTAGDYNQNGVVDAADYTVWRDSLGQQGSGLAADGSQNNVVDDDDYLVWKANFGQVNGSGSGGGALSPTAAAAPVPEPSCLMLSILVLLFAGCLRQRRRVAGS